MEIVNFAELTTQPLQKLKILKSVGNNVHNKYFLRINCEGHNYVDVIGQC